MSVDRYHCVSSDDPRFVFPKIHLCSVNDDQKFEHCVSRSDHTGNLAALVVLFPILVHSELTVEMIVTEQIVVILVVVAVEFVPLWYR